MKKNEKLFVGGYYDDRIFEGEQFDGKTPFSKDVDAYSLSEVLELGFVEGVKEWYEEREDKNFDDATEAEQIKAIIDYTDTDEIAGLTHFDTEKEALSFKNNIIKEIEDIEKICKYVGKKQDSEGYFREVYKAIEI